MKKTNLFALTCVVLFSICNTALIADTLIVDPNGFADYTTIQDAINNSLDGDIIEVMPATYFEKINFNGLAITVTSTNPNDTGVVESTIINGEMTGNTVTFADNETNASVLAGITVENGSKGIYCNNSSPLIQNCVISYSKSGPGISGSNATPKIDHCIIKKNKSDGIYGCDGQILNCTIEENTARGISNCNGAILYCDIINNGSDGLYRCNGQIYESNITANGGHGLLECDGRIKKSTIQTNDKSGIYNADGIEINNCIISGNKAYGIGFFYGLVNNCTVVGNIYHGILTTSSTSAHTATVSNSIIVDNDRVGIYRLKSGTTLILINNNIWNNTDGQYNNSITSNATDTHVDPLFAISGSWDDDGVWVEGDYHLLSEAGRWSEDAWTYDTETSPCIDAGDPASTVSEPSPNGGVVNQGAYGGTSVASKSMSIAETHCTKAIPGDVNGDCKLNLADLAIICQHWLECNLEPQSACYE